MSSRVQELTALLPDYNISGHESILGGMFAGIVGVLIVIGLYMLIHRYHEKHTESH
jgi:cobalt/nickel transport system permease protein